jgi:DNA-binding response OmpR family regulator
MPDAPAALQQAQCHEVTVTGPSRPRLLVVEDEALVAMLIEDVLADAGFEVVGPFGQAAKALSSLADETVDAAILDVNLGGGERSYSVANELSERGVPYIFLTGYGRAGIDPRYADIPVLQKPFEPQTLCRLVNRLLA